MTTVSVIAARAAEITATIHLEQHTPGLSPANVVVWLTPIDAPTPHPVPRQNVRLIQKNKEFTPHLLVVPTGTSIEFPNLDPFFHNVFSLFNGKRFDLGLYETGARRSVTFDREGVSYIFCNIHPEMGAVVIALNSPYFGISDAKGSVTVHDVPPGRYRLQLWSEQLLPALPSVSDRIVDISSDSLDLGHLDFKPSNAIPAHHKNKFGKDYPPATTSAY
ncbi:hypothetical protein H7846_04975 [Edaphobacter sp. 4G125]|nr:hypothetical protein H7846_04975 [Edaphobacter sp. 4G125]